MLLSECTLIARLCNRPEAGPPSPAHGHVSSIIISVAYTHTHFACATEEKGLWSGRVAPRVSRAPHVDQGHDGGGRAHRAHDAKRASGGSDLECVCQGTTAATLSRGLQGCAAQDRASGEGLPPLTNAGRYGILRPPAGPWHTAVRYLTLPRRPTGTQPALPGWPAQEERVWRNRMMSS